MEHPDEKIYFELKRITKYASYLTELSFGFGITGNTGVQTVLDRAVDGLELSVDNIRKAMFEKTSEDVKQAQENSAAMFDAVLAGFQLKEKSKNG